MTSLTPHSEFRDYKYMYSQNDIESPFKMKTQVSANTIIDILESTEEFSKFLQIVKKAGLYDSLSNPEFQNTMFIPLDKYIQDVNVNVFDKHVCKSIVQFSTIANIIDSSLINMSPLHTLFTNYPADDLHINSTGEHTKINSNISIVGYDIEASNGLFHTTDGLLIPVLL